MAAKKNTTTESMIAHNISDKGKFTVAYREGGDKDKPQIKRQFQGVVRLNIPTTAEGLESAFSDFTFTADTAEGKREFKGLVGAAMSKFTHAAESVRGTIRTALEKGEEVSDEDVIAAFATFTGPGRGTGRTKEVAESAIDAAVAAGPDAVKALLAKMGAKITK